RADDRLRSPSTVEALRELALGGYVGRADGEALLRAYRYLRMVEHRLQLQRLRRKLLYRPLLEAVAKVPSQEMRMYPESARARLEVLGFADPAGALRHIE